MEYLQCTKYTMPVNAAQVAAERQHGMLVQAHRRPFSLFESARVRNGSIVPIHSWNCHVHRGGDCGCDPHYALKRERKVRGR